MHEMSLLRDLLHKIDQIAQAEGAASVVHVKLKLGALAHISPGHLREHFEEATDGHVAQDATLEIELLEDEQDPQAQEIVLESVEVAF